ncbi:hypothetical protein SAMN04488542_10235 [Fontibacillus panacisegetis]|uniref:Uncharacterized protein n=1 Tax=Fontibacillus panacisegetis TaxID=670482 RepID=A0A1G7FL72_9BACL|nr:hypothetical protein SAMN04488542_10235 [Fontibacillus panacisegetis]
MLQVFLFSFRSDEKMHFCSFLIKTGNLLEKSAFYTKIKSMPQVIVIRLVLNRSITSYSWALSAYLSTSVAIKEKSSPIPSGFAQDHKIKELNSSILVLHACFWYFRAISVRIEENTSFIFFKIISFSKIKDIFSSTVFDLQSSGFSRIS